MGEIQVIMIPFYFNNFGVGAIAISAVLAHMDRISLPKLFLIYPFISHQQLLYFLARKTTSIVSVEKLIVDKTSYFSNFNQRYEDTLSQSLNALQYLAEVDAVKIEDGYVYPLEPIEYQSSMGKRAEKIFKSSENIASLLKGSSETLYLNLRVEL